MAPEQEGVLRRDLPGGRQSHRDVGEAVPRRHRRRGEASLKALVTGGSRGIGAAIVVALRADGVEVVAPTRAELDLADPASLTSAAEWIPPEGFDILVNCAGINRLGTLATLSAEAWTEMQRVDLEAPLRLMQAVLPGMAERGWGRVVNIASVWALVGREGRGGYAAAKGGLAALSRVAALEVAARGVFVNVVCPGYIETELTRQNNGPAELAAIAAKIPAGRLGTPEEVAALVAWLCSTKNGYLTGQILTIDGGYTAV